VIFSRLLKSCKRGFIAVWTESEVYDLSLGDQIGDVQQGQEVRVLFAACQLFYAAA